MQKDNLKISGKAFTLIELLVVISIIAVLMSIMMPALRKARQMAQRTVCQSQMKGHGIAMRLYAEENNNDYITHEYIGAKGAWFARLGPYIGKAQGSKMQNAGIFLRCPAGQSIKDYGKLEENYNYNAMDITLQAYGGKLDNIVRPSEFGMFFDFYFGEKALADYFGNITGNIPGAMGTTNLSKWALVVSTSRESPEWRKKVFRHSNGINIVRADGHVEHITEPSWWKDIATQSSTGWKPGN